MRRRRAWVWRAAGHGGWGGYQCPLRRGASATKIAAGLTAAVKVTADAAAAATTTFTRVHGRRRR